MQTINTQTVTIDIRKRSLSTNFVEKENTQNYIPQFVQGDTNILEAVIKDGGVDADLSDVGKVIANFKRKDKHVVSRSTVVSGNVVTYTVGQEEMQTDGFSEVELQFYDLTEVKRISTLRFRVNIMAEIGSDQILTEVDGPTLVQELLVNGSYAQEQGERAEQAAVTAQTQWLSPVADYTAVTNIVSPQHGDTIQTEDNGYVYRYENGSWKYTQGYSATALADVNSQLAENVQNIEYKGINVKQFGAIGDGETDDTNSIQDAFEYAKQYGITRVEIPSGVYKILGTLKGYTDISLVGLGHVMLDFSSRTSYSTRTDPLLAYFGSVGTSVSLSADINYLDTSITVSDTSGFVTGDLIEISTQNSGRGDANWDDTSVTVRRGEIVQIKSISGNVINFNEPLVDESGYLLTDSVSIKKVFTVDNIAVDNITFKGKGRPSSGSGDIGVLFKYGRNVKVKNCRWINVDKRGVEFISCFNFEADSNDFIHPDKGTNDDTNYSVVTTGASRHGRFKNNTMKNSRHGITTSHISSASSDFVPGLNRFMTFEGNQVFNTWHAGISMHSDVEYVTIQNNDCISCLYGIETRERNVTVKNNKVVKSKNSAIGIYANKNVKNVIVSENTLIGCVIYVTNLDTFRSSPNLLVTNNIISDVLNQSFALQVEASNGAKLKSVNVSGNIISNFVGNAGNSAGLRIVGDVSGVGNNNEVRKTTNALGARIFLGTNNFFFTNNRIINSSSYGLSIETGTYKNLHVLNNFFAGYTGGMISGVSNATSSTGNIDGGSAAV